MKDFVSNVPAAGLKKEKKDMLIQSLKVPIQELGCVKLCTV